MTTNVTRFSFQGPGRPHGEPGPAHDGGRDDGQDEDCPAPTGGGPTTTPETPATGDRPVHELRFGRVRCSVWKNESDTGPWYSVKLTRLYKTDDGWKASPSLNRDDLLPAAKLCEEAALWIFRQQQQPTPTLDGTPPPEAGDDIPF